MCVRVVEPHMRPGVIEKRNINRLAIVFASLHVCTCDVPRGCDSRHTSARREQREQACTPGQRGAARVRAAWQAAKCLRQVNSGICRERERETHREREVEEIDMGGPAEQPDFTKTSLSIPPPARD